MASVPPPNPTLARLAATLSDADARELVRMFLREYPSLRDALAHGNSKQARLAAHSLKSSAQHMGATALANRMAGLEERLEKPGASVAAEDVAAADRDFAAEEEALRAFADE